MSPSDLFSFTGFAYGLQVVYPDWSKGNHYPGVIVKCDLTRNKERIYDIDLSDGGGRLVGVREEYIRAIVSPDLDGRGARSSSAAAASGSCSPLLQSPLISSSCKEEPQASSWDETACLCQKELNRLSLPSWPRHCSPQEWNHRCRM